jgi:hypothetical protein
MINKQFELIGKENIDALVADEVAEGKTIEYKEQLPGNSDTDKKEFLADVSSFANASGGDLLYGIREKRDDQGKTTGIPESVEGLDGINVDEEIRRLENTVRNGIDPRIPNLRTRAIKGFAKGPVILIRIPKSWVSPHMVTYKRWSRFYTRDTAGKHPLDVIEIRSAFLLSESLVEKVRHFRTDRIAKIIADETPVPLIPCGKIVLHVLPIAALDPTTQIDMPKPETFNRNLDPICTRSADWRYNFDGLLKYGEATPLQTSGRYHCYLQLFRNGAVEAVEAALLIHAKKTFSTEFERELIDALDRYLTLLQSFGLGPPIFVMLALVGVRGYIMTETGTKFGRLRAENTPIDRDVLILPDIFVEDYNAKAEQILRPAFDSVWQACGYPHSLNYNERGEWVGRR